MDEHLTNAYKILLSDNRSFEDLEFLERYLQKFEDIRRFFFYLNSVLVSSLCRCFVVKDYKKSENIHFQGQSPDMYYLILKGTVSLLDGDKLISKLGPGKAVGEREIIKNFFYSNSAVCASAVCLLLAVKKEDFLNILGEPIKAEISKKLVYLHMLMPNFLKLSQTLQDRLISGVNLENYFKGVTILNKGIISDSLLLIVEGECALAVNTGHSTKEIIKITKGSTYAEECILYNQPTEYALISKSDCTVAFIKKSDIYSGLSENGIKSLKNNYDLKKIQRNKVQDFSNKTEEVGFPLASSYAKKKLAEIVFRSNKLSPSRLLDYHHKLYGNFKDKLIDMRDTSSKRIFIPTVRHSPNKSFDFDRVFSTLN